MVRKLKGPNGRCSGGEHLARDVTKDLLDAFLNDVECAMCRHHKECHHTGNMHRSHPEAHSLEIPPAQGNPKEWDVLDIDQRSAVMNGAICTEDLRSPRTSCFRTNEGWTDVPGRARAAASMTVHCGELSTL